MPHEAVRLHQPAAAPGAYTAADVAALLRVHVKTVRRLDARGEIPGRFVVGRAVRYRRAAVDRWIEAGCPVD